MSTKSGKPEPKSRNSLPCSASSLSDDAKAAEKSTVLAASSVSATGSTIVSSKAAVREVKTFDIYIFSN